MDTDSPSGDSLQRKRITRNRISHSCRTCRTKRVRCDRLRPSCTYCCGAGAVCVYDDTEPGAVAKRRRFNVEADSPLHIVRERSSSDDIEVRDILTENQLRVQKVKNGSSHNRKNVGPLEAGKAQAVVGYLSMRDGGRSRYANSTFWADVCGNEKEVSDLLHDQECYPASEGISFANEVDREQVATRADQSQTGQDNSPELKGTPLPSNFQARGASFGSTEPTRAEDGFTVEPKGEGGPKISLSNLFQELPDQGMCDVYYQSFVDSVHSVIPLVHLPSFHQEYLSFWEWRNCTRKTQIDDNITAVYPSFLPLLLAVLYAGSVASKSHTQDFPAGQSMLRHSSTQLYKCIVNTQSLMEFPRKPTLYSLMAFLISENLKIREEEPLSSCSYISTAIRIAQIMGLHRDGTHFQLDPIEVETRRRVWWHILHTDVMLATIAALPPLIISDRHYDTRMISELKDDYIVHEPNAAVSTQPPTSGAIEVTSDRVDARLVLTIGRYQATNTIRRILRRQLDIEPFLLPDCLELENSVEDLRRDIQDRIYRLRLLQKQRNQQMNRQDSQEIRGDRSIRLYLEGHEDEFIDWASELLNLMVDKAYCLLYQPFAKDRKGAAWLHVRDKSIKHSQSFINTFISMSTLPLYAPFYWLYPGLYQPLHVTAILLVDLGSNPTAPEAPKTLALIDRLFSIMSENGVESMDRGILNPRSLSQSGREAWRLMRNLRTKTWEALGLDPAMIWSFANSDAGQGAHEIHKTPNSHFASDPESTVLAAPSNNTGGTEWPYIDSVIPRRNCDTDELLAFPDWEYATPDPFPMPDGVGFDGWAQQDPSTGMLFNHDFTYDMGWIEWQAIIENGLDTSLLDVNRIM